jgi:hypothetical protein
MTLVHRQTELVENKRNQMISARELLQDWNEEGIYNGNWILVVGFPHTTELLGGSDPDVHQALQNMMASGGRPLGLVGVIEDDDTLYFEFCMVKQYERDSQAIQHIAAVIRRMQGDPEKSRIQDIGTDDFSEEKRHRKNQEWARKQDKTIARFVRTRQRTSELPDGPARTMYATQPQRGIGRLEVNSEDDLTIEAVTTKPATRTVGDLLEALQIASHNKQAAFLVIGFEQTTKFICSSADGECDVYEILARLLDLNPA